MAAEPHFTKSGVIGGFQYSPFIAFTAPTMWTTLPTFYTIG